MFALSAGRHSLRFTAVGKDRYTKNFLFDLDTAELI